MKDILQTIQNGRTLSANNMEQCVSRIMNGEVSDIEIAAFLMGLSVRGESVEEIIGAARVMRAKARPIKAPKDAVDCCGTGGDHAHTYNISTAVAIVAAACGVTIAKHGNRASSSKSGAADVLEALGVNLDTPQEKLEEALKRFHFAFLMAPRHHESMKYVAPVRKALKIRTIFNLLGPLANPADTKYQLIGVYDRKWILPMAQALKALGTHCAWVVHGADGLDEITVTGPTYCAQLSTDGRIIEKTLSPDDFGLKLHDANDLKGSTPQENAAALLELLKGNHSAYRDIVLANTAATLCIAQKSASLKDAVSQAADAIDSGAALNLLQSYIAFTRED